MPSGGAPREPGPGELAGSRPVPVDDRIFGPGIEPAATIPGMTDERPYSPGLEGVVAAETGLGYVDGERGRLLYRGYRIGDLVEHGSYPAVANLLYRTIQELKDRL